MLDLKQKKWGLDMGFWCKWLRRRSKCMGVDAGVRV